MKFAHGSKAVRAVLGLNPGQWDPERILLTMLRREKGIVREDKKKYFLMCSKRPYLELIRM